MERKRKERVEVGDRRPLLDENVKRRMLAVLITAPEAFEAVKDVLTVNHVAVMGEHFALLWNVVVHFYAEYNALPDKEWLLAGLHQAITSSAAYYDAEELEDLDEFVAWAYDPGEQRPPTAARVAVNTCRQFIEEFLLATVVGVELSRKDGTMPIDLCDKLRQQANYAEAAAALGGDDLEPAFEVDWDKQDDVRLISTGISALDIFLGGGSCAGEISVFMSPSGGCKSLTMVQSSCGMAEDAAKLWAAGDTPEGKRPVIIAVSTETPRHELQKRAVSCMAKVSFQKLMRMRSLDQAMSTATTPQPYEQQLFAEEIKNQVFRNERQRVDSAVALLNQHVVWIEYNGRNKDRPTAGAGGVAELSRHLQAIFRRHPDIYPYALWVDHARAWADAIIEFTPRYTRDDLRFILESIPLELGKLGSHLKMPVWVTHQVSGEANSRGSTSRIHHSDAAECRTFATYAVFSVQTTTPDAAGLCKFECTKHRREPPRSYAIMRVDGDFCRVIDVSSEYVVQKGSSEFRRADEVSTEQEAKAKTPRPERADTDRSSAPPKFGPKNNNNKHQS